MLKRAISLGLITTTFLLAACGDGGSNTTGAGASGGGAAGGTGGMGGAGGAGGAGGMGGGAGGTGGEGGMMEVDPLVGIGTVEEIQAGFMFTEGPQWIPSTNTLLFTDIPANRIYAHSPGGGVITVFREPSANTNGLGLDPSGLLVACEHSGRRVSRTLADGTIETIADLYENKKLNSPNDVIVHSNGTVYFTDPPYGLPDPGQSELGFFGVFRVTPGGEVTLVADDMQRPNGIALSPDEKSLYVADTQTGELRTWPVNDDGSLGAGSTLVTTGPGPDGMAVDEKGNLFVTTKNGVEVYSAAGKLYGAIAVPQQPSNCAFGGEDKKTLYITARTGLYRVTLANPGLY
ncbi:SMP-30/gluconolactonase/LRE family protein [Polyangium spumosum]|nr:SMP-30/gluconolactonase/LRE family protein [Polyangium spumosum]